MTSTLAHPGSLMIEAAEIRNFRCFEQASLRDCRPINVVVGKNASGKTALLESLFLTVGPSPELATRFRNQRGYEGAASGTFQQIEEAIWGDLFFKFDRGRKIDITLTGTDRHNRQLEVTFGSSEVFVQVLQGPAASALPPSLSAVQFQWTRGDGRQFPVRPQFTGAGYQFPGVEANPVEATFFASSQPFHNADNLRRFSNISKRRKEKAVIEAIRAEFDFIRDVDIQSHGGISMLHADIPYLPEKVPLVGVSSGVNKFVTIILAAAEHSNSIVLIDEIENGFHFSRMESIWRSLHQFCKDNGVQIFASTHSDECLKALANACASHPDDVSLIRCEMRDGVTDIAQFVGEGALGAMKLGEVR